jgi:glycerophosphoryl diester phosphodiesterase
MIRTHRCRAGLPAVLRVVLRVALPVVLLAGLLPRSPAAAPPAAGDAPGARKLVIAHRGASGYLPEHTLPAYAMAYALGADFIELDVVATRDGVLVVLHDVHLEPTTDVETVFPRRPRLDGHWYAADFTAGELRRLRVHERTKPGGVPAFPQRFPLGRSRFAVPTLDEAIELVQGLNATTGCRVGLYIELKGGAFHAGAGLALEPRVLETLARYGYRERTAPVFLQSFEPDSLRRLRALGTRLRLVQLIGGGARQDALVTPQGLAGIATYADGIGPAKRRVAEGAGPDGSPLVRRAHAAGLVVHPWTFRADELGAGFADLAAELRAYLGDWGVDGVFIDHPDRALPFAGRGADRAPLAACAR